MSLSELARREAGLVALDALGVLVEQMPRLAQMATQEERAAVVAWIKRDSLQEERTYEQMVLMGWIAQEIERGEHRREED